MTAKVNFGVDYLLSEKIDLVERKKIGLITNHTGVTRSLDLTIDVLLQNPNVRLVCLFGPEHGVRGDIPDALSIPSFKDPRTGLPVYSLYGEHLKPTREMLSQIDALLFDIQDVGCRYYTYIATMNRCMQSASESRIEFILLDRPNPINGVTIEGNVLEEEFCSFVGERPIPIRYGMTLGELAKMFNHEFDIDCDLHVVKAEGWKREMWYDETELPWVMPSPNMPTLDTATVYPGTCLIEGTNVSEGRGTTKPFEIIGAPWIDAFTLRERMTKEELPGVLFRTVHFIPMWGKYTGEVCGGVQLHVFNRDLFRPVLTGLKLIKAIMDLFPGKLEFRRGRTDRDYSFDLLAGTNRTRIELLKGKDPEDIMKDWEDDIAQFSSKRAQYLLYP